MRTMHIGYQAEFCEYRDADIQGADHREEPHDHVFWQ